MENKKIIIFESENLDDILFEILKNNGVKETLEDYVKKVENKSEPSFDILHRNARSLADETMTSVNFIIAIQQQLNVSEEIAKNILKEVKDKLLPLAKIISEEELEKEGETLNKQAEQAIENAKYRTQNESVNRPKFEIKKEEIIPAERITPAQKIAEPDFLTIKKNKKIEVEEIAKPTKRKTAKQATNDIYRESVE